MAVLLGLLVQNHFQKRQSFTLLREYIEDFEANLDLNATIRDYVSHGWGMEIDSGDITFDKYLDNAFLERLVAPNTKWVTSISIVDHNGIAIHSSDPDMVGYDLHESDYLSEFLCVLDGVDYYARDYYPDPLEADENLKLAYSAVSRDDPELPVSIPRELFD